MAEAHPLLTCKKQALLVVWDAPTLTCLWETQETEHAHSPRGHADKRRHGFLQDGTGVRGGADGCCERRTGLGIKRMGRFGENEGNLT